jgi:pyruvate formate lyase activating enzyme
MGIHTVLDTNGHLGDRLTDDELEIVDLVLLDIKSWDRERHRLLTGKDVEPTLNFARRLASRKRSMWLRYVLVPGLTDDLGRHKATRSLCAGHSEIPNESMCCRFIRWAATNGRSSTWITNLTRLTLLA